MPSILHLDGQCAHYVEVIQSGAERLRDLLDDMLNLRELELRTSALRLERTCLQEMIGVVLTKIRPFAEAKQQHLIAPPDTEPIFLLLDEEKMGLALEKLLANAVEFTPEGGTIEVRLCVEVDSARIDIEDTGIGIPAAAINHIFEPFYQVEDSLRRQHDGIGLGLPVARGMVNLHGGSIVVDSEEGRGTLVTIRLPLRDRGRGLSVGIFCTNLSERSPTGWSSCAMDGHGSEGNV